MELENETIMITELPKAIKSDPRKFWRISLAMIGLFTRDNKHSFWQWRKEPMVTYWPEKTFKCQGEKGKAIKSAYQITQ